MGKHARKKVRISQYVFTCTQLLSTDNDRELLRQKFRRLLDREFTIHTGRGEQVKISPRYLVRYLGGKQTYASHQLLHVFVDALLMDDFHDLEYHIHIQIGQVRRHILSLHRKSHRQRHGLVRLRDRINRRKRLVENLLNYNILQVRLAALHEQIDKHNSLLEMISIAENYIFPDTVSQLRNGKGNRSFSIGSPFQLSA